MSTMKAVVIREFLKPMDIGQVPIPKPNKSQVLIKMKFSGFCGTDHHAWRGDLNVPPSIPIIPGHEGVGEVVEVGSDVTAVNVGDTVGVAWLHTACGHCEYCFGGWETMCEGQSNTGYSVNGTLAEYVVADPNYVARIPDGADLAHIAPILCAGVTVYKGLKMTEAKAGNWVLVSGLGGLGQLGVQYAKAMGFNVIGVDIDDEKLKTAKRLGAAYAFNALKDDVPAEVKKAVGGVHAAIVTAVGKSAFGQTFKTIRRRGTMVCIGLPPGEFALDVMSTVLGGITVRGSAVGTRLDMIEAIGFFTRGQVKNDIQIEKLDDANKFMELMEQGKLPGRIVYDFSK